MRTVAVLIAGLVMTAVAAQPASAAPQRLALSLDGHRWSRTIGQSLFGGERRWVPGDESTVGFWVRNDSAELATLTVTVVDAHGTLRLGRDLLLSATVDGRPTAVSDRLVSEPAVDAKPRRIQLTARLPESAGNETQQRSAGFWLEVRLSGDLTPEASVASRRGSELADTGMPRLVPALALLGTVLVMSGVIATTRARRGRP